jgi:hypothetical protein
MIRRPFRAQLDLFVVPNRPAELPASERHKALALLQTLLTQAAAKTSLEALSEDKEAGDE